MSDSAVQKARELLSEITPGPWSTVHGAWGNVWRFDDDDYPQGPTVVVRQGQMTEVNARFIAAAPQLVADLIAEVKRLTPREIQHQEVSVYAALPIGSVVMDARRDVYERWTDGWVVTDLAETEYQDDGDMDFPLAVLYVPEVQS